MSSMSVSLTLFSALAISACGSHTSESSQLNATSSGFTIRLEADQATGLVLDGLEADAEIVYQATKRGDGCGDGSFVQLPYAPWWPHYVYQPKMERQKTRLVRDGNKLVAQILDRRSEACGFELMSLDFPAVSILNQAPRVRFSTEAASGDYVSRCQISPDQTAFACQSIEVKTGVKRIDISLIEAL